MQEIKVGILLGGKSSEHEISLQSGVNIAKILDKNKYSVKLIPITKNGDWIISSNPESVVHEINLNDEDPSADFFTRFIQNNTVDSFYGINFNKVDCDVFIIGLHGGEGENGTIQGFLDTYNKPYTGSGVLASAIAMDKDISGCIFKNAGMNVPAYKTVTTENYTPGEMPPFGFPVILKPASGGSSVGVKKISDQVELDKAILELFSENSTGNNPRNHEVAVIKDLRNQEVAVIRDPRSQEAAVMIQEYISGTEVSCGVLDVKKGKDFITSALPVTEIIPSFEFFDYKAKYTKGLANEITPADISREMTRIIQDSALRAHQVLGCKGYSRTDFIIKGDRVYILETNTLPGMTGTSLIPQQVKAAGYSMPDVFDWLIEGAMKK